jgi:hypothetical protein
MQKPWSSRLQVFSPHVVIHMVSEILLPRKLLALSSLLLFSVFLLLVWMIQDIVQASFGLLLIALIATIVGFGLWLIGLTGYVGNIRA